jgi:hypothetical protein
MLAATLQPPEVVLLKKYARAVPNPESLQLDADDLARVAEATAEHGSWVEAYCPQARVVLDRLIALCEMGWQPAPVGPPRGPRFGTAHTPEPFDD